MKKKNFPRRREARQAEAAQRQKLWDAMSTKEKLQQLSDRGYGDSAEAAQLRGQ